MFAAPIPTISWFGSTSSPRRAANADDVAIVSVSDTSVMPTAAMSSGPDVGELRPRQRRLREALRERADGRDLVGEAEHRRHDGGADDRDEHGREPSS